MGPGPGPGPRALYSVNADKNIHFESEILHIIFKVILQTMNHLEFFEISSILVLSVATLSCITKQDNDWRSAIPKGSGIWCLVLPVLQDELLEKDKELKTIKLDLELQERATEAKIAEKIAALVEEVYSAQRERDKAVMARLRLANEERDEAFLRVQRLEESLKELENINPEENDMTLQELLNRINNADTGIDILKNGAIILNRIHRTKERKKKIIAEEMNAVIEQRDAALSQVSFYKYM
ncbi:hypothetical protein ASZ78_003508 [Callipepla squamata]|uniref:Mirror-image polydactyly gene 1 protein n=1 Tax=Callipepla squamata TaxID=9009 RepID=A0A226NGR0_CALSU|nr:hypothetical protein ASZ78_003508 [Callipepla squamata]